MNLREHIATKGLKTSMEGNFGLPVELIAPDGTEIKTNEIGGTLKGQILYDTEGIDPDTGELVVVGKTEVSLRRTALSQVPASGEKWLISIPVNPAFPTVLSDFMINTDQAMTGGQTMGFIKLQLKQVEQI